MVNQTSLIFSVFLASATLTLASCGSSAKNNDRTAAPSAMSALDVAAESLGIQSKSPEAIYGGKIGNYPILMQIAESDSKYYYIKFRKYIDLEYEKKKDKIYLKSELTGDSFVLTGQGGILRGTMTTASGKNLPVALSQRKLEKEFSDPALNDTSLNALDKILLSGSKFEPTKEKTIEKYKLQFLVEKSSGAEFPRFIAGLNPSTLRRINAELRRIHYETVLFLASSCSEANSSISEPFVGDGVISFAQLNSYDCGGAHPNFGEVGFTVSLSTGQEVSQEQLQIGGVGAAGASWTKIESDDFPSKLVGLLNMLHPDSMKRPSDDDSCDYSDPDAWQSPQWYITKEGVRFIPNFPAAQRACNLEEFATVPLKFVRIPLQADGTMPGQ